MAEKKEKRYISDNAQLMAEWNWEKNTEILPTEIMIGSGKIVWWKCSKGHEWQATPNNRTPNKRQGCPYCSNHRILVGFNDLATTNPNIAKEWHPTKNESLTPRNVTFGSKKRVWWKCRKGHEWQATICNRNKGRGCPLCSSERHTSFPEYALEYYLKKYALQTMHSYRKKGYELDIYIPSKRIAIEYDGYFWHKNKEKHDLEKNYKCKKDGIKLYRIRSGLPSLNDSSIDYVIQKNQRDLEKVIKELLSDIIGVDADVNLKRDAIHIENLREYTEKEVSILMSNPQTAIEWYYERNGNLRPENFTANSSKKVWWKCNKGHEWQATIDNRNNGKGCPYCSGRYSVVGENDLQTVNPNLAKEWNYEKNNKLTPSDVLPNSNKKVWWKCSKGHEWQATVASRTHDMNCPYCSGRYSVIGESDLQTVNPDLAKEWNYEKNNKLTPSDVLPNSNKKVWWKCSKGHEWQAVIYSRTAGSGCPYCSGKKVLKGYNDLQTLNPTLSKEWNCEKNGDLRAEDFTVSSGEKVWWKCGKGHEWQAVIYSRNTGNGCPYCSGKKALKGYNDLQTLNPMLSKEWNYTRNGSLRPEIFTANSGQKVWWKCGNGHEWQARISSRNSGTGCPQCAKEKRKKAK